MSARLAVLRVLASLACAAATANAAPEKVCPDPQRPCRGFKAHDLSFPLLRDGVARDAQRSRPFFAVILKTAPKCSVTEKERLAVQALFPRNKVFATRFHCDDTIENNVSYTNVDANHGFIAVHAGDDRAAADEVLAQVRATGKFPGANVRRMQVEYVYP